MGEGAEGAEGGEVREESNEPFIDTTVRIPLTLSRLHCQNYHKHNQLHSPCWLRGWKVSQAWGIDLLLTSVYISQE